MKINKLVIDRTKWLRGEGSAKSKLLRSEDGKMCCMGFWSLAIGQTEDDIKDNRVVINGVEYFNVHAGVADGAPCSRSSAYEINDNPFITDTEREARLKLIFEANGIEVEFVN